MNLYNGSGSVSGNSFSIADFVGTANWRGTAYWFPIPYDAPINPDPYQGPYAAMHGAISRSGSNASVSGTYTINAPGSHGGAISGDRGTFAGSGQLQ
ncbi:MAG: hypothetical protein LBD42_04525 [Desulfovibrio sp.]|nr:hypothetical protein [Desulfovibrio sp.]